MCKHDWRPRMDGLGVSCQRCGLKLSARDLQAMHPHDRHEVFSGRQHPNGRLQPTEDTWVSKGADGALVRVPVREMSAMHIVRWVRRFRDKYSGPTNTWRTNPVACAEIDSIIIDRIVTGRAILEELTRRGLTHFPADEPAPSSATASTLPATLDELVKAATIPLPLSHRQRRQRLATMKAPSEPAPAVAPGYRKIDLEE